MVGDLRAWTRNRSGHAPARGSRNTGMLDAGRKSAAHDPTRTDSGGERRGGCRRPCSGNGRSHCSVRRSSGGPVSPHTDRVAVEVGDIPAAAAARPAPGPGSPDASDPAQRSGRCGKTLLAADWAAGLRQPVAWLTAEEGDGRPGVFWAYLVQALRACGVPACGAIGLPSEAARVDHKLLATLAAELNERDQPVVVVLDEYDRVTAPRRRSSWNSSCTTPAPACAWSSSAGRNPCCRCIATGQPAS